MAHSHAIDAFLKREGRLEPFHLHVSMPAQTDGESDYYCVIHAPQVRSRDVSIFGVDAEQAKQLAIQHARRLLEELGLFDAAGNKVAILTTLL